MNSYTYLSKKPSIVLVSPGEIGNRLDAMNFRYEYLENRDYIRNCEVGSVKLVDWLLSPSFRGKGFKEISGGTTTVIKVRNVTNYGVTGPFDNTDASTISPSDRAWARGGDVLLTVTGLGSTGKADLFLSDVNKLVDGHIAILRCKPDHDSGFLKAFLSCSFGQKLSEQDTIGSTGQIELYGPFIDNFDVPNPDTRIQYYIGEKVRLAEMCREKALQLRSKVNKKLVDAMHLEDLNQVLKNYENIKSHIISQELISDRLDADFYKPKYLQFDSFIKFTRSLPLSEIITFPQKGVQPEYDNTGHIHAITVTNIDPFKIDVKSSQKVSEAWASRYKRANSEPAEILISVTGPPLGETAVVHHYHGQLVVNSHIARIKMRNHFPFPNYLAAVLNSPIGTLQVYRYCKGVRQQELYPEEIMKFKIPEIDPNYVKIIDEMGCQADILEHTAEELFISAIHDIENLITGKLDIAGIASGMIQPLSWEGLVSQLEAESVNK